MDKFKGKLYYDGEMDALRKQFALWKKNMSQKKSPFFLIYTDFKEEHLKDISGGALKLYLYLGFHVKNETGECWHSIETISDFFGIDQRTTKKWLKELDSKNLIRRFQTGYMRKANTFLLPYGKRGDINNV